jgi:hypothetical protein
MAKKIPTLGELCFKTLEQNINADNAWENWKALESYNTPEEVLRVYEEKSIFVRPGYTSHLWKIQKNKNGFAKLNAKFCICCGRRRCEYLDHKKSMRSTRMPRSYWIQRMKDMRDKWERRHNINVFLYYEHLN